MTTRGGEFSHYTGSHYTMEQRDSQFGAEAAICMHAARAIGPSGQCGASATSYVSVYDARRWSSLIPPQCETCKFC